MIKIQRLYEEQTKMHTGIDKIQISSQHTHIGLEFLKKVQFTEASQTVFFKE